MQKLNFDYSKALGFINEHEVKYYESFVKSAHEFREILIAAHLRDLLMKIRIQFQFFSIIDGRFIFMVGRHLFFQYRQIFVFVICNGKLQRNFLANHHG